jgi:hypothetical protein
MKLQRYVTNDGVMPPGEWVKSDDAEALETAAERATANMVHAQNRVAELEAALRDIADYDDCDCDSCPVCIAHSALRTGGKG